MNIGQPRRADKANIRSVVIQTLRKTARGYAKFGDPNSDLRDAPEYLLTVSLAQGLTTAFPGFRYRLEHSRTAFKSAAKTKATDAGGATKDLARFDIVLINAKTKAPNYIFEVKRGKNVLDDAKRIIEMAALESGRKRWRHGFLVTVLRRSEENANEITDDLVKKLQATGDSIKREHPERLPEGFLIRVKKNMERIGKSNDPKGVTQIWGVVFHIELVVPAAEREPVIDAIA